MSNTAGGEAMCRQVCQAPTEAFARAHGILVRLDPRPRSMACDWTWGEASEDA